MSEDPIRKVLAELQRRFRIAGRGSVTRVEKELGLSAGYFKDQRRPERQRFDLKILFRALDALKVNSSEFFASVLGPADPLTVFKVEGAALRRKKAQLPRILVLEAERHENIGSESVRKSPETADLDSLDSLRYDNPGLVMRRARSLMPRVDDAQVPFLLGAYASACRVSGRSDEAVIVLTTALERAAELGDQAALADLLLRAGYIVAERGQQEMAFALAERATVVFARCGDLVGIGRSLIDQGMRLFHMGRQRRAAEATAMALQYLVEDGSAPASLIERNRWSCLMNLCLIHRSLGELDLAEGYARQARDYSGGLGKKQLAKIVTLEAAIARDAGRLETAEHLYREAVEIFRPIAALDTALCSVEVVRIQLRLNRTAEAYKTAKAMMPLLEPLEKSHLASAALAQLLRCALTGHGLSEALLQSVAGGLQQEQETGRRPARARVRS